MLIGTALLVLALLALTYAFARALLDLRAPDPLHRSHALRATAAGLAFMVLGLLFLAGAFLVGDLSIHYVWANVDLRYAWYQRLSGLWVGRAGSLLLWTTFTLSFWALEELRHHLSLRHPARAAHSAETAHDRPLQTRDAAARLAQAERVRRVARPFLLLVTGLMLLVVLLDDPFRAVEPAALASEPWGRGVNPQLIIPLNAIHPPIVFVGYALCTLPTAFALGHLVTGDGPWLGPARRWAHLAFLFLTLGVGLGGLWAYIALGWGGYWAWDPVEVGSVVPWIAVTAFLHAGYRADGRDEFPIAAPAFAFLVFPAALFSTFVVRAGGVWVSLHSFLGPGAANDPWQRFWNALVAQPEVKLYTGLMVGLLVALVVLTALQIRRVDARLEAKERSSPTPGAPAAAPPMQRLLSHVNLTNLFVAGVLLLALLGTVTITVLVMGVNGFPSDTVRAAIFTERTAPVALSAVLVMALAIGIGVLRKRRVLALVAGGLALGAIGAVVFNEEWALAMAVPVLVVAAILAIARIVHAWRTGTRRHAVRFTGIHLVHLGIAILFLGHGFVSTFEEVHPPAEFQVGDTKQVGPYALTLTSLVATDTDENGRLDDIVASFDVRQDDVFLGTATTGFQYYDFQSHYKPDVGLEKQATKDIYLAPIGIHDPAQGWLFGNLPLFEQGALEAGAVDGITIQVSTLPYIDLVWTGAILMVGGAALLASASWRPIRPQRVPEAAPATEAAPA